MTSNNVSHLSIIAVAVLIAFSLSACSGSGGGSHSTAKNGTTQGGGSGGGDGGGDGGGHAPKWRLRPPGAGLRGGERLHESGEDHPELHRRSQQDGLAERNLKR